MIKGNLKNTIFNNEQQKITGGKLMRHRNEGVFCYCEKNSFALIVTQCLFCVTRKVKRRESSLKFQSLETEHFLL